MKIKHIIPLMLLAGYCVVSAQTNSTPAESKSIKLDNRGVPFGTLGFPVGSYLTIEGVKEKQQKLPNQHWLVDTVNGRKLNKPVSIDVERVSMIDWTNNVDTRSLPDDQRFIFKGYETLEMMGIPPGIEAAANESGQGVPAIQQGAWRLDYFFVVTSVVVINGVTN
jgi:hypothetical protein